MPLETSGSGAPSPSATGRPGSPPPRPCVISLPPKLFLEALGLPKLSLCVVVLGRLPIYSFCSPNIVYRGGRLVPVARGNRDLPPGCGWSGWSRSWLPVWSRLGLRGWSRSWEGGKTQILSLGKPSTSKHNCGGSEIKHRQSAKDDASASKNNFWGRINAK